MQGKNVDEGDDQLRAAIVRVLGFQRPDTGQSDQSDIKAIRGRNYA